MSDSIRWLCLPHNDLCSHASSAHKVYKIQNLTDEEATLIEPAACAVHGMDKLGTAVGIDALVIGAGPTGLVLAQLLKLNGAHRVVVAANKGIKTQLAMQLEAAHEYVELDRQDPAAQWEQLKKDNPYGFDVVVRALLPGHYQSGCVADMLGTVRRRWRRRGRRRS